MTTPALTLMMTTAGLGRFTAAQIEGDIDLTVAQVGFTNTAFVPSPTLTALPGEFRRVATISGQAIGDNIVHMIIRDEAPLAYQICGFGLFLADGTLFAFYGQTNPIAEKAAIATLQMAIDIAFPTSDIANIAFGDTNFLNPPATTELAGVVELATQAEVDIGTDTRRVAPVSVMRATIGAAIATVMGAIDNLAAAFGEALDSLASRSVYGGGLVKGGGRNDTNRTLTVDAATPEQLRAGAAGDAAATPAGMAAAGFIYLVESRTDGASRYRRYSDGLIEMTGVSALPGSESSFTLNFPWAFPTECECLFATVINSARTDDGQSTVQEVTLAADHAALFAQNHKTPTADAMGGFRWLARGR